MSDRAECEDCNMNELKDDACCEDQFKWPNDYQCARGGVYFPDSAHLCGHFGTNFNTRK